METSPEPRRRPGPKGYPPEMRAAAVALEAEIGPTAVARQLGIDPSTVIDWRQQTQPIALALNSQTRKRYAEMAEGVMRKRLGQARRANFDIETARDFRETMVGAGIARDIGLDYREGRRAGTAIGNRTVNIYWGLPDLAAEPPAGAREALEAET